MGDTSTNLLGGAYVPLMITNSAYIIILAVVFVVAAYWMGRKKRGL